MRTTLTLGDDVYQAVATLSHQFHPTARRWLEKHESLDWATCAITQLGFIRISCQASIFGNQAKTPEEARIFLSHLTAHPHHTFFSELPTPSECPEFAKINGPNKVTDAYLIGLVRHHHARFVTFDTVWLPSQLRKA
jgi:toxin-antitoxin system PIN domain toxin